MSVTPKVCILYLHNVPTIDMSGIHTLEAFLGDRSRGYQVLLADVPERTRQTLEKVGIARAVGHDRIFPTLHDAIEHARVLVENTK